MTKNDPARMAARKLLSTVIPDRVRSALADAYELELMPGDTYGVMLHKRLLQLAETDPEAAVLAEEYGLLRGSTGC